MDLVIMAAGIGSRFGGLKQIKPIDENGNFIIDYSIFDAVRAGFDRVVFIIKRDNLETFKETVGKRIEKRVKVEYAFQDADSFVPFEFKNVGRQKPWGTGHAILCAKGFTSDRFAVINADDFYGAGSFKTVADFLRQNNNKQKFCMVGYNAKNTMTKFGEVKRGICNTLNGNLRSLIESAIRFGENGKTFARSIENGSCDTEHEIDENSLVSMNLFGFTDNIFDFLEKGFNGFLTKNKNDLTNKEFFIPSALTDYINSSCGDIAVLPTEERWLGLTYKEDFDFVKDGISNLVTQGCYPKHLW